ncbi:Peptidyl-prolyl cis-trans isomerase-like 2 [Oopsacas minuta]|uniref:RING-type E3 ubiquitin-protein ligase PPIL2 n=1 Tax=Oopsacas minuta TaxID=111878 RepID=A0AAV7JQD6_9METZ|nr:Peptidyl-prolyl cis-trans isomerase-like 2 [Oopsacas minuta]
MGKKQHQKDKMYLTTKEWSTIYGGKKASSTESTEYRRLPYNYCGLSLQPAEHPYCTEDGILYDLPQILPFLKKFKHCPITGKLLNAKSLIKVNFHKNADSKIHCPMTYKEFTEHSHVILIKTTGNVYSNEALQELNIKPKNFRELLSDEPFAKSDIITLQDPKNLNKFNITNFFYIKHDLSWKNEEDKNPMRNIRHLTFECKSALEELYKEEKKSKIDSAKIDTSKVIEEPLTERNTAHYSTGQASISFTSTATPRETHIKPAKLGKDLVRYSMVKKKGYVRLVTNFGNINLELHCEFVSKTCENFLKLCKKGYYDETIFHRSIRNFVLQGGDPKGDGSGGQSFWGEDFKDEFKPNLLHSDRGILSMANSGPDTNRSQFFITYRLCMHLNNKHTVFGKVVGGFDILDKIEKIKTDKHDLPISEVKILTTMVFVDPFQEVDDKIAFEDAKLSEQKEQAIKPYIDKRLLPPKSDDNISQSSTNKVGKYLDVTHKNEVCITDNMKIKRKGDSIIPGEELKKKAKTGFGDFSSW